MASLLHSERGASKHKQAMSRLWCSFQPTCFCKVAFRFDPSRPKFASLGDVLIFVLLFHFPLSFFFLLPYFFLLLSSSLFPLPASFFLLPFFPFFILPSFLLPSSFLPSYFLFSFFFFFLLSPLARSCPRNDRPVERASERSNKLSFTRPCGLVGYREANRICIRTF